MTLRYIYDIRNSIIEHNILLQHELKSHGKKSKFVDVASLSDRYFPLARCDNRLGNQTLKWPLVSDREVHRDKDRAMKKHSEKPRSGHKTSRIDGMPLGTEPTAKAQLTLAGNEQSGGVTKDWKGY